MRCKGWVLAAILSAGLAWAVGAPAPAATASLVADLNTTARPASSGANVYGLQALDGGVLFLADRQLWWTDGTPQGTRLIHDFCVNLDSVCLGPRGFAGVLGGTALLLVDSDEDGKVQLWGSDGTIAGTLPLATDLIPASNLYFQQPEVAVAVTAGKVLFFACGGGACGLWRSDGTLAGTMPVATGQAFSHPLAPMAAAGGRAFCGIRSGQVDQLWTFDGTPSGTALLGTFAGYYDGNNDIDYPGVGTLFAAGSRLFFLAEDATQHQQLWRSDGTPAGTLPVTAFPTANPFGVISRIKAIGDRLYFVADDGAHGAQLYVSDGSPAGARAVTAFTVPNAFGFPAQLDADFLAEVGGRLLFVATDGIHPSALWTSGGTPATTAALTGCPRGCPNLPAGTQLTWFGQHVLFEVPDGSGNLSAWASDGTGAGTLALGATCPRCGPPSGIALHVVALAERAVFEATSVDGGGLGIWITDGTVAGTQPLLSRQVLAVLLNGQPVATAAGGKVYFGAGGQLWISDGTLAGTSALTVLDGDGPSSDPVHLFAYGGGVLFSAYDGQQWALWSYGVGGAGSGPQRLLPLADSSPRTSYAVASGIAYFIGPGVRGASGGQLWRTDGTAAGTVRLSAFTNTVGVTSLAVLAGRVFFSAVPDDRSDAPLWTSDGTVAGTGPVQGLSQLTAAGTLTALGTQLYFLGTAADGGDELFVSDGTAAGTRQLTHGLSPVFVPLELVRAGGAVYFRAADPNTGYSTPVLWKTDGTAAGTAPVLPSPPAGSGGATVASGPSDLAELGGALLFFGFTGHGSQRGLFRSDGTAAGTVLLAAVAPPYSQGRPDSAVPASFTALGNRLLFAADDGEHGLELWQTDGTIAGTAMVKDIAVGASSSRPGSLVAAGGLVFFSADDREHGVELWQTDGTAAGTRLVQDIAPGLASSYPASLTPAGGQLYFNADDGIYGAELWAYPLAAGAACLPSPTAMCLLGSRFRVEASWRDFSGGSGAGHPVALTDDTGYFWFFDPANVEVVLKTLDGRGLNDHFWAFYGALSSVQYELTVTDCQTGAARRYVNPPGVLASVADTSAFGPRGAHAPGISLGPAGQPAGAEIATATAAPAASPCVPDAARLCLGGGRFEVKATWRDFQGNTGVGKVAPVTGDTGYFWFFDAANVEVMLKVLDGRPVNGKFWVFYGALSSVEYTLTVTDTQTGVMRSYSNPAGRLASVADTSAF